MAAPLRLTSTETRLAEQYVSVLDFVSRCAKAIDEGDWHYLWDKSAQLEEAVGRLHATVQETCQDLEAGKRQPPRAEPVRAAVADFGRHYRAAWLLHPTQGGGGA